MLSTMQPTIAKNYFPNPAEMSREDLKSANANLRGTLQGLQVSISSHHISHSSLIRCADFPIQHHFSPRSSIAIFEGSGSAVLCRYRSSQRQASCYPSQSSTVFERRIRRKLVRRPRGFVWSVHGFRLLQGAQSIPIRSGEIPEIGSRRSTRLIRFTTKTRSESTSRKRRK